MICIGNVYCNWLKVQYLYSRPIILFKYLRLCQIRTVPIQGQLKVRLKLFLKLASLFGPLCCKIKDKNWATISTNWRPIFACIYLSNGRMLLMLNCLLHFLLWQNGRHNTENPLYYSHFCNTRTYIFCCIFAKAFCWHLYLKP